MLRQKFKNYLENTLISIQMFLIHTKRFKLVMIALQKPLVF